ncbi:MAG: type IV secretory system conjugative DNA transfer family protein [Alphaproteobacteria bacterium]|nr:type IV secretory system conjugative DNA transfer family protein [Alphaproteobacteria bacterium]
MNGNVNIAQEKSRLRALFNVGVLFLVAYLTFLFLSAVCFLLLDLACRFNFIIHEDALHVNWIKFFCNPLYIFELYGQWWNMLVRSVRLMVLRPVLFIPFIVPAGIVITTILFLLTRDYSFGLWYVLNHHFAKLKDVNEMGLHKGMFMVLGRFANMLLSVKPAESVLCIGEMGTGKTSSVAIPSVLRSDNACIIGVDMTGLLPKYTAGYRSKLGKVVYYNWDLLDDHDKGMFYPRWNPLADDNMPINMQERDAYLKRIAGYLIDVEDKEKDNYWNVLAHSIIVAFLGYWTAKVAQAKANDYFLTKMVEGKSLSKEEKNILLSYYLQMPNSYAKDVMLLLERDEINQDNYLPIGSWAGVPEQWIGKEVCFALITDWLIDNYMSSVDDNTKDWRGWFESLLRESVFFSYGNIVTTGFRQVLALSVKQRQLALACVMRPFRIFTHQAIRERTNGNDFNWDDIRGIYDKETQKWCPVTIYSMANTYASKILNQMFLDEALYRNLNLKQHQGPLPVMLVLDDVGHNLRLKNLIHMLEASKSKKISALLLCNSLSLVENTYSKRELECVVVNTSYKIIKAPDNQKLSRQLDKLATFATKSVQIPRFKKKRLWEKRKYFADASYFHRLALDFKLRKNVKIDTKDHQIVLMEGYYNRPILADNVFFAEDNRFSKLAVLDAEYTLSQDVLNKKIKSNLETPKISDVFNQKDLGVDDIVELDQYMDLVFDEVSLEVAPKKKEEKLKGKIKNESVSIEPINEQDKRDDWWLNEDAFMVSENTKTNPFIGKK